MDMSIGIGRSGLHCNVFRRRKKPDRKVYNICDDFNYSVVPQDTNTTTYLCVDIHGCCNFTTIQSAVNAVTNFSINRTVLWINSGFY